MFLNGYAQANDPFKSIGDRSVSVNVTSVVRASDTSFLVKWTEQSYQQGSLASTENWTAILTTTIQPPKTADTLRKNPLGLYVTGISWSQDFNADSTP